MPIPKAYVDTNIFKFSATALLRFVPRIQQLDWGGITQEVTVHDLREIDPNESIKNPELKEEADLLPDLASLGKNGEIQFLMQMEARLESWGIPNMDSQSGNFYGAPIERAEAPIFYERVLIDGRRKTKDTQYEFLSGIKSPRFLELQKATGAYQGENELNRNQLLDAFHLWCAEHNRCDYFLTMDFKLIRMLLGSKYAPKSVRPVKPSQLLAIVQKGA